MATHMGSIYVKKNYIKDRNKKKSRFLWGTYRFLRETGEISLFLWGTYGENGGQGYLEPTRKENRDISEYNSVNYAAAGDRTPDPADKLQRSYN